MVQSAVGGRDVEEAFLWLGLHTNVENLATLGGSVDVKHRHDVNFEVNAQEVQCNIVAHLN
jgi:hypothetical protein